jgi:hypothetical protein
MQRVGTNWPEGQDVLARKLFVSSLLRTNRQVKTPDLLDQFTHDAYSILVIHVDVVGL